MLKKKNPQHILIYKDTFKRMQVFDTGVEQVGSPVTRFSSKIPFGQTG